MFHNRLFVSRNMGSFSFRHPRSLKKWTGDVPEKIVTPSSQEPIRFQWTRPSWEDSMCDFDCFMTQEILEAFTEEISARKGKVTETFNQPGQLFVRSVLPPAEEIRA